ncbi:hypothetical protein LTS10_004509 [Elasticomyces elasticus]|nr:hypothetical protein LTS10_004509 [Elasticomyces elasticus]
MKRSVTIFALRVRSSILLWILYTAAHAASVSVHIVNGTVHGVTDNDSGIEKFLGIPFAEPPVGDRRLRQAAPLEQSFGTLDADDFGPSCISAKDQGPESEDCLTLNIWRPSSAAKANVSLPVLVWLYGGSLTSGYTADPRNEATAMTRISSEIGKPIIVVSVTYRLGPFGFLNGAEMTELGQLNLGMLDQRLALRWLQDNIKAFGGDPAKVTLAGQSAGAVSIYSHMMAYGGRDDGLFRGAILQSGGAFPFTAPNTTAFQSTFDSLITNTTCSPLVDSFAADKLKCIRSLLLEVFKANVGPSTGQSVDGGFTRTSIQRALPACQYVKVATIVGSDTDEGTTSAPSGVNETEGLVDPVSRGFFRPQRLPNETVSTLIDLYPDNPRLGCPYNTGDIPLTPGKLDKKACSIFGDIVQIGPARMIAQTLAQDGVPVYRYRFSHLAYNTSIVSRGITTGSELPYMFSNNVPECAWDQNLAYQMTAAWASFAHDLDPNVGKGVTGLPHWPCYGEEANTIVFNGYGSSIQPDNDRSDGIRYIIGNVLTDGAM